jgi:hypothetical protein
VHGDDLGARQPGGGARLAGEPLDELRVVGEARPHHLDGDRAVEPGVGRGVDRRHAAAGDGRVEPVALVEEPTEQGVGDRRWRAADTAVHGRVHDHQHRSVRTVRARGAAEPRAALSRPRSARAGS